MEVLVAAMQIDSGSTRLKYIYIKKVVEYSTVLESYTQYQRD